VTDSLHKYTITVDSTQASAAITSVETALQKSESAAIKAGASVDKVATDWGKAANALKERTEKGAAAMAILAQSMGNTESAGGKLVAGAGTLAATYGAGGPWMVALVAGAGAIEYFTKKQYDHLAATEAVIDRNTALTQSYATLTTTINSELQAARDANYLAGLPEGARGAGQIGLEQSRRDAQIRAQIAAAETAANRSLLDVKRQLLATDKKLTDKDATAQAEQTLQNAEANLRILRGQLASNAQLTLERLTGLRLGKEEIDHTKAMTKAQQDLAKAIGERSTAMSKAFAMIQKSYDDEKKKEEDAAAEAARIELEKIARDARISSMGAAALVPGALATNTPAQTAKAKEYDDILEINKKIIEGEKSMRRDMEQLALSSYGVIAGASQQLVADLITGQDHALEHFATSIMAQAGQSLIASSVKLAGEATVSAFTPGLQPLAIAQGSAAAGLFAGGLALGGLAVGAEHVMAGGSIGQKLPDQKSGTPMGFGGRSSSGGNQGSGTNVTIVYSGASGPSADDGARAVTMALTLAQRRGQYNNNLDRRF
jgi:hypothetical protein